MIRRSKGKVIEKCEGVIASEWHFFMKKIGVRWKLSSGISNRALIIRMICSNFNYIFAILGIDLYVVSAVMEFL